MGPRAMRATSRKAANELPETARANFLTAAAQLLSTSLPQLSTHLGQQALLYADAQQALVASLSARSQLCKKCGSPLNNHTCANVHIAWLSNSSSERLSKKLPANSSGPSSTVRGGKAAGRKQKNTVVAVRVCVVCQEPSVRPFLSVSLAQKHLAAEGFTDVPVVGLDPKQQAEAQKQKQQIQQQPELLQQQDSSLVQQQESSSDQHQQQQQQQQPGVGEPAVSAQEQLRPILQPQEQQQQQEQLGHPADVQQQSAELKVGTALQQQQEAPLQIQQQQQQPQKRELEGAVNPAAKKRSLAAAAAAAGPGDTPDPAVAQQHQHNTDPMVAEQQQKPDSWPAPQQQQQQQEVFTVPAAQLSIPMDQQQVVAVVPVTAVDTAAQDDVPRTAPLQQKAVVTTIQVDTAAALPDQQQQQPEASSISPQEDAATAESGAAGSLLPAAAAVNPFSSTIQQQLATQSSAAATDVPTVVPPAPAGTDVLPVPLEPFGSVFLAPTQKLPTGTAAAVVIAEGSPVVTAAVVTPEQPGASATVAVSTQPIDLTVTVTDTGHDFSMYTADADAATTVAAGGDSAAAAAAMPAPLSEGIDRMPSLYSWQATPPPAAAAAVAEGPTAAALNDTPALLPFGVGKQAATERSVAGSAEVLSSADDVVVELTQEPAPTATAAALAVATTAPAVDTMELDVAASGPAAVEAVAVEPTAAVGDTDLAVGASKDGSSQQQQQHEAGTASKGCVFAQQLRGRAAEPAAAAAAGDSTSPAVEPAPAATAATPVATPAAAAVAAGTGVRGLFGSSGGKSAAARIASQAWPIAPVTATPQAAAGTVGEQPSAGAVHGLVVITDDRNEPADATTAAAAVAGPGGLGPGHVTSEGVEGAGDPVADDLPLGEAVGQQQLASKDVDMADATADDRADIEAATAADAMQPPTAAVPPAAPREAAAAAADQGMLQRAASLQRATSSGIEADVSSEMDNEAAVSGSSSDQEGPTLPAAAEAPAALSTPPAAPAAAALSTSVAAGADDGDSDHAGSDSGAVSYHGPWVGGVRPAHASEYDTDSQSQQLASSTGDESASVGDSDSEDESEELDKSDTQDESAQAESQSDSDSASESESESEYESQSEDGDRLPASAAAAAAPLLQPAGTTSATVGSRDAIAGSLGTQPSVGLQQLHDTDEFFEDEGGTDHDSDVDEGGTGHDSDVDYESESDGSELSAEGEDMSAEYSSDSEEPDEHKQQPGVQQQQQQPEVCQPQQVPQRGGRWHKPKLSASDIMLRHVATRSHLLRKKIGRKALRHRIYR